LQFICGWWTRQQVDCQACNSKTTLERESQCQTVWAVRWRLQPFRGHYSKGGKVLNPSFMKVAMPIIYPNAKGLVCKGILDNKIHVAIMVYIESLYSEIKLARLESEFSVPATAKVKFYSDGVSGTQPNRRQKDSPIWLVITV
jgi:hypothetical protein